MREKDIGSKKSVFYITFLGNDLLTTYDFPFIDYTKAFDCVDHNKLENSERDGNTRPP